MTEESHAQTGRPADAPAHTGSTGNAAPEDAPERRNADGPPARCGFVAVMGAPNAGKSTLVNALVGARVCIVSPKAQTTRSRVLGIAVHETHTQIAFIDTPGVFAPKKRLDRAMVSAAWQGAGDADCVLLVVDVTKMSAQDDLDRLIKGLSGHAGPVFLALNKVDRIDKTRLPEIAEHLNARMDFEATFMISALKGSGLPYLMKAIAARMPEGPWLYDADTLTDVPARVLAAEMTREQIFRQLHDELPYGMAVMTENWERFQNGDLKIDQVVYVSKAAHKPIVLGKGGSRIKSVGQASRHVLSELLDCPVHLKLHVKVQPDWMEDAEHYAALGLDFRA